MLTKGNIVFISEKENDRITELLVKTHIKMTFSTFTEHISLKG